ncbi:MAG: type II toxin-antitoxin system death-on-curing family toxin [Nitrososphaerota archaeon]|nr:type II toxin-antitoxin system death-on-curing family toxin [Nitrososphaerota archaeon]
MTSDLRYPSFEAVTEAHRRIIGMSGGHSGMISTSNLKYILETVQDIGEELGDDKEAIVHKAAYLMYNIVVLHPFLDGNKRSAFEVTKRFLELNGWSFKSAEEETFKKLVAIGAGSLRLGDVEAWIGMNLR